MPELKNKQHELFCLEIASGQNNTQAAINAGYSEKSARKTGNRLRTNADISARIDELMAEITSEKVADAQEVMEYLTSVLRGKSQSSVLARDEIGAERVIEKPPDEKERLKAAELLLRHIAMADKADRLSAAMRLCTETERRVVMTGHRDGASCAEFGDYLLEKL